MIKLGIAGSGLIVKTLLAALKDMPDIKASALCVRPGSREKGSVLAEAGGIPALYTDYALFLKEPMDMVYIGIVNDQHFAYAKQAIEAGKSVILEKPFTVTLEQAAALKQAADEKSVYLFEAITTLFMPNFLAVKENLHRIGRVRLAECSFIQYSSRYGQYLEGKVPPVFDPAHHGGALMDLNVYNLHFLTALFGKPLSSFYHGARGFNQVDTSGTALLYYPDFYAVCTAAKDCVGVSGALISGEKGAIRVEGAVNSCPQAVLYLDGKEESLQQGQYPENLRMRYELEAFIQIYRAKDTARCQRLLNHSLTVMEVLESLYTG